MLIYEITYRRHAENKLPQELALPQDIIRRVHSEQVGLFLEELLLPEDCSIEVISMIARTVWRPEK